MTVSEYEPIYPFRAESFKIVKNPANTNDWSVVDELEKVENEICKEEWNMIDKDIISHILESGDVFYGHGFVTGPGVPSPECANEEFWHMYALCVPLYVLEQCSNNNRPIC